MKKPAFLYLFGIVLYVFLTAHVARGIEMTEVLSFLTRKIPPRPENAMTGSEFARYVSGMDRARREDAIVSELLKGNFPNFLRRLKPVYLHGKNKEGKPVALTIFTMPDYLAIGSESDSLLIPMNLYSALAVALKLGFTLPTKKIVDTIFAQSEGHFTPEPLPACPEMRSTEYYTKHNQIIRAQRQFLDIAPDALVSGHKKDVVLSKRLAANPSSRVAIYGWQRRSGMPIQPLSTVHNAGYADYSHGIRLVSETVFLDNNPQSIYQVLRDHMLAGMLSDEGPLTAVLSFFLPPSYELSALQQSSLGPLQGVPP